jgi:hypothetical protein
MPTWLLISTPPLIKTLANKENAMNKGKFYLLIFSLALLGSFLAATIAPIFQMISRLFLAFGGGVYLVLKFKEEVGLAFMLGASVICFDHFIFNCIVLFVWPFIGLEVVDPSLGSSYVFGALIFSTIIPSSIFGALSMIGGLIGNFIAKRKAANP